MKKFLCLVLATVLALLLPAVQFSQVPLPRHVNGFAQTEGVVRQTAPSPFQIRANMANENQNPYDTLDDAVLAAVKQACAGIGRWYWDNPFVPDRSDLTGIVFVKLYTYARPQLESIWTSPDPDAGGYLGVLRFVWRVAEHAAIDEKRRNEADTRAPEILATRLDKPIPNQDGEQITLADTIPDEDGTFQAFQFGDLRESLTEQEYELLYESIVNGSTQQEIAKARGVSDSTISRQYTHAKQRAAKWVQWLSKRTVKQVRANIHPTFSRRPCQRPDGISRDNIERWNDGLHVGEFRDPACEWRPRISNQPRIRAKRECYNAACQNGLAIGPDNLVLPAARRHEAVRFLPAYTGKDNRLCAGCKALDVIQFPLSENERLRIKTIDAASAKNGGSSPGRKSFNPRNFARTGTPVLLTTKHSFKGQLKPER